LFINATAGEKRTLIDHTSRRQGWLEFSVKWLEKSNIRGEYFHIKKYESHDRAVIDHGFFAGNQASRFITDEYQVRKRATSLLRLSAS
jgi:hypothetical protein